MIRIFHAIVETRYAPEDKDVIWLFNGVQYYWTDKGWTPIGFQSNGDIQGVIESLNTIKLAIDNLPHGGGGGGGDTSDAVKHIVVNGTEIVKTEGGVVSINIPIRVSELINDNGYTTGNAVDTKLNALANQLQQALTELDNKKQNNLISGVNIKTINHQSLLGSGNIDIQGGSGSSYSKFKSIVFKRQSTIPTTPTGGSYDNPVPEGWSDGVPSGELTLWMSSRWFSTEPDFVDYWTTPSQATDTADIDFEWSSLVNPALPDIDSSAWHNEAQPEDIWMAFRKKSNGVWGPWSKIKIKGEAGEKGDKGDDGKDGTSVHILGAVSSPNELPSTGTVGDSYIYKGPDTTVGGKPWKTGDLIVWDGDSWESVGQIQGPKGESNYVFIAYSNDGGNTLTINDDGVQDGTKPGKYVGYCITTSNIRPINASSYQPFMKFQGEDGFGYEFIYKLTTDNNPPLIPDSENRDEYIPDGWNDNPSVSEGKPYCWMVYRKKFTTTSGEYKWSQFIGDGNGHANLFSKFSNDGTPGESAYSLQLSNTSASVNCDEMYQVLPNAVLPSPVSFQLYYGKNPDNESDVTYNLTMIPGNIFGVTLNTVNKTISFDRNLWSEWDAVEIVVNAFKGGILVATNKFSLTMNPPGPEGKPATNHWLVLSDTTVKQVSSMIGTVETKELYPSAITVRTFKQVGDENAEETTRNLRVTYSYDGNQETNFTTYDTGLILEKGHKVLTFKLYDENSILRDTKTVTFLSDGSVGRQGAAVRGPIYWTNDTRRWYNGKESSTNPSDAEWIDIVIYDGKYYRCTTSYNGRESDTWDLIKHNWTLADGQFDFVATKVLLANDARIQFLSSNEIYMMNGNNLVAGVSGGEYNFWAGAERPENAPFRVKSDGTVFINNGIFKGFIYQDYAKVSESCQLDSFRYNVSTSINNYILDAVAARVDSDEYTEVSLPSPVGIKGYTFNFLIEPYKCEHSYEGDPHGITYTVIRKALFTNQTEQDGCFRSLTSSTGEDSIQWAIMATSGSIQFVSDGRYWVVCNSTASYCGYDIWSSKKSYNINGEKALIAASFSVKPEGGGYGSAVNFMSQTGLKITQILTNGGVNDFWTITFDKDINLNNVIITPIYNRDSGFFTVAVGNPNINGLGTSQYLNVYIHSLNDSGNLPSRNEACWFSVLIMDTSFPEHERVEEYHPE